MRCPPVLSSTLVRLVAPWLLAWLAGADALAAPWQPDAGLAQHPVWPEAPPGARLAVALYSGHLWVRPRLRLAADIRVTRGTPPTFLLHAQDDPVDDVNHSLAYYAALKEAGVPTEMHLYAQGGHAFGLRRAASPITAWPALVETWLATIGMTP